MKLRDRLRTHKGTFYNWPPIWTNRQDSTDKPQAEIGTLQDVLMSEEDDYDVLFIAIEYQGRSYMGAMGFESAYLLSPDLHCLTVAYRTFGFEEIGDIDLP